MSHWERDTIVEEEAARKRWIRKKEWKERGVSKNRKEASEY